MIPVKLSSTVLSDIVCQKEKINTVEIAHHEFKSFEETTGYLGDHFILKVKYREDNQEEKETNFFIKTIPLNIDQKKFALETGGFNKEIFINLEVFTKMEEKNIQLLTDCKARCYYCRYSEYLIFDNLQEKGFVIFNRYDALDFKHVLVVIRTLAKLHASSLIYEELVSAELQKQYRFIHQYEKNLEEAFYNDRDGFINKPAVNTTIEAVLTEIDFFKLPQKLKSGKNFKEVAKECCEKIYQLVRPSKKFRNVLCHSDLWLTNIMFKYDEGDCPIDCKLVDFQYVRYNVPAHDLFMFLHLTTTREFRERYMDEILHVYYDCLRRELKSFGFDIEILCPFNEFLQGCEEQKLSGIVIAAFYFQITALKASALEELFGNEEERKSLFENKGAFILRRIEEDPRYRDTLQRSIFDLYDYCENHF